MLVLDCLCCIRGCKNEMHDLLGEPSGLFSCVCFVVDGLVHYLTVY